MATLTFTDYYFERLLTGQPLITNTTFDNTKVTLAFGTGTPPSQILQQSLFTLDYSTAHTIALPVKCSYTANNGKDFSIESDVVEVYFPTSYTFTWLCLADNATGKVVAFSSFPQWPSTIVANKLVTIPASTILTVSPLGYVNIFHHFLVRLFRGLINLNTVDYKVALASTLASNEFENISSLTTISSSMFSSMSVPLISLQVELGIAKLVLSDFTASTNAPTAGFRYLIIYDGNSGELLWYYDIGQSVTLPINGQLSIDFNQSIGALRNS